MSRASDLYALQEVDTELNDQRAALEQVEAQLGESEELAARQVELAMNRSRLAELEAEQRDIDLHVREQREHVQGVETRLYGGSVGNPRELVALQEDVEQLRSALSSSEDRLLEILTEIDDLQNAVRTEAEALETAERKWQERQGSLVEQQKRLTASVAMLTERRALAAAAVSPADMHLYQMLANMKQGKAVGRAERGMCMSCRINLPLSVMQRARNGQELVQCTSCERILFAG